MSVFTVLLLLAPVHLIAWIWTMSWAARGSDAHWRPWLLTCLIVLTTHVAALTWLSVKAPS